jgi:hypothetical protein
MLLARLVGQMDHVHQKEGLNFTKNVSEGLLKRINYLFLHKKGWGSFRTTPTQ